MMLHKRVIRMKVNTYLLLICNCAYNYSLLDVNNRFDSCKQCKRYITQGCVDYSMDQALKNQ